MEEIGLVTGGSRGIGRAIAVSLASTGLLVAVGYREDVESANETVGAIRRSGGRAFSVQLMLESHMEASRAIPDLAKRGFLTKVLVNNAAVSQPLEFNSISTSDWDRMMNTNLRAPFLLAQAAIPTMEAAGWGRIINLSSIGGQWGGTNQVHYAVAKSGLIGLTRSLAKLLATKNITVNAVSPGLVETDMVRNLPLTQGSSLEDSIPIGRLSSPEEVAAAVLFLCSQESGSITGHTLNVNGGMYFS